MFFNVYNSSGQLNNVFGVGGLRMTVNADGEITSLRTGNQNLNTAVAAFDGGKVELVRYTDAGVNNVIRSWSTAGA